MKIKSASLDYKIRQFIIVTAFMCSSMFVVAQVPVINSFSPLSGPLGTAVTISGSGFNATPANNIVYFGAIKANVVTAGTNSLSVTVPAGATFSPVTVTVNGLTGYSNRPFMVTFEGNAADFDENSFATAIPFATVNTPGFPSLPGKVESADIDGDGKTDIVALNSNDSTISIMRNSSGSIGNIALDTFRVNISYTSNNDLSIADFDGDGKRDIVTVSSIAHKLGIVRNISSPGTVSFTGLQFLATENNVFSITTGDIDGDGKPDIIISEKELNKISIFRNTSTVGNISFAAKVDFATGNGTYGVKVGDLDNDHKADIVVANSTATFVSVFKNNSTAGNIILATRMDLAEPASPFDVVIGDVDGDGKPDIVAVNYFGNSIALFQNTTSGTLSFAAVTTKYNYQDQETIEMADLNGDGKPEVVTGGYGASINVFKNISTPGTMSLVDEYSFPGQLTPGITIADLDADAKPELVSGSYFNGSILVLRNKVREPSITSVTPFIGGAGTTLTITGSNLDAISSVTIGGLAATFTLIDATSMTVVVPNAAFDNTIIIGSPAGTATFNGFFYTGPKVNSVAPHDAGLGDTVIISGYNFTGATAVKFGNTAAASFVVLDPGSIRAILGAGSSGKIYVATADGFHAADTLTYYLQPVVTSFTPATAASGDQITVKGNHFFGTGDVQFGNVSAASWTVLNDTTLHVVVGSGATGNVSVTTYGGTGSKSGFVFVGPVIRYFTPASGTTGDTILIRGNFLLQTSAVSFGSVPALTFIVVNDTTIKAVVGAGNSGPISVTTASGTSSINNFVFSAANIIELCPPVSYAFINSPITGVSYQWQSFNGNAFVDIHDNSLYANTNAETLVIINTPSSMTGSLYRCNVGAGIYTDAFQLKFVDQWVGVTPFWDDPNNWSCGTLPDVNTDVIINSGTVIVNMDVSIRSLTLSPGVVFTVMQGYTLTVTN